MLPMRAGRETLLRGLHHALGIPGLIIGTLSLLMVLFGAIVFEREYDRLARARSAIVQRLVSRWVRTASADYLNTNNLVDAAERWRGLDPDDSEARQAVVRALARMGEWLQTQNERTPVL
jgi:hypothetical protein